ncbi:hypothetical protein [Rhodococcoides fascians]|uniref:hypothetical protein n=1 Tax=Rhodococcoides fascians TaxID=1828 RepID=UPI00117B81ED|nr:hypothetical protein [Rhodococcus fascians]
MSARPHHTGAPRGEPTATACAASDATVTPTLVHPAGATPRIDLYVPPRTTKRACIAEAARAATNDEPQPAVHDDRSVGPEATTDDRTQARHPADRAQAVAGRRRTLPWPCCRYSSCW